MSPTNQIDVPPLRPLRASLSRIRLALRDPQCAITRFRQNEAVGLVGEMNANRCRSWTEHRFEWDEVKRSKRQIIISLALDRVRLF